jgi:ABC-type polar amino acid transport system ATPase subunit
MVKDIKKSVDVFQFFNLFYGFTVLHNNKKGLTIIAKPFI